MDDDYKLRQRVNSALRAADPNLSEIVDMHDPSWWGLAVSDVALLTGSDEILLADTFADQDREAIDVRLIVITSSLVIAVTGRPNRENPGARRTRSWSRADLIELEIEARRNAFGDDVSEGSWPGAAKLTLTYRNGETFTVPTKQMRVTLDQILDLLPSLRTDLDRSPAPR